MAHKKGAGSSDNGRDSKPKYLGVKLFGGQTAIAGNIIVRQRGTKFHPGDNAYMGKDFTIHARVDGTVVYRRRKDDRTYVSIRPADEALAAQTRPILGTRAAAAYGSGAGASVATAPSPAKAAAKAPKALPATEADLVTEVPAAPTTTTTERDDLKLIEGIGPKIEEMLNEGGLTTFASVADAPTERIQAILDEGGPRYRVHDPSSWAQQARLAADGKMDELQDLKDRLSGGRDTSAPTEDGNAEEA